MENDVGFGGRLKQQLDAVGMSASEAARLAGCKSRNSIFRILQGSTSAEVSGKFLDDLQRAIGNAWPEEAWASLRAALEVERVGWERYRSNSAFLRMLHEPSLPRRDVVVQDGTAETEDAPVLPFEAVLAEIVRAQRVEIVITGCYDAGLLRLLADVCTDAGESGRLTIRHYIDVTDKRVVSNILGVLPLVGKNWYNARLVSRDSCPEQALQLYRLHTIYANCYAEDDRVTGYQLMGVDDGLFSCWKWERSCPALQVLDRLRFHLELLKPTAKLGSTAEDFLRYTSEYAQLEDNCVILSIKQDVHFNCIPPQTLEASILEGFEQAGIAQGEALRELVAALWQIHQARFDNMLEKHKATHLVYSLPAMEQFMRTGVLSDHFFIQRAYTIGERREIIRTLRDAMLNKPWFELHFLKADCPGLCHEISYYGGKGVMLMDANTCYDLEVDHSEALITLPVFMERFHDFFMEKLLADCVMSRVETLRELERLMQLEPEA